MAQLRKALGPGHIANVARKGYRLVTPVQALAATHKPATEAARPAPAATPALGPRSIAVLPFGAQGLPDSLSFLRESLTGALIAELSRQPGLTVLARGTMLTFGDSRAPPQVLAQELGVRFVVDGLLEQRGDTLHVSVQVADGERGTQTFADALELPVNAWHETAAVVVGRLARALHFEFNDLATRTPVAAGDTEMQARALSAQAWVQLFALPQTRETNEAATALAARALALAPQLAQAWMCQAFCDWRAAQYGWSDERREPQMARALSGIERAVALDPRDPDGHYVLALVAQNHGQLVRAEEALRHCLRLAGSFAPAHGLLGLLRQRRGFAAETPAHVARALALSPREPLRAIWYGALALALLDLGDAAGSFEASQRGMAVNPNYPQAYLSGVAAAQQLGLYEQARDWVRVVREQTAFNSLVAVRERMERTYAPGATAHFERLIGLLRDAGLPAH